MSQQMPPQQPYVQGPQASSLPSQAQARLNNMRHDGNHQGMFTSQRPHASKAGASPRLRRVGSLTE